MQWRGCDPWLECVRVWWLQISNLNRQFLFRAHNVGQPKSLAASVAAKDMNPDLRVSAMEELVHEGSEHIFNDAFWMNLDFVTNALDNVKARKYVDGRCVLFEKPLLESGTLGTKANVQVVLPHQTISYADGPEEVEQGIPMCTLRNFPSQIEHCIEWARVKFNDFFCEPFKQATKILKDSVEYAEAVRAKVAAQKKLGDKLSVLEKTLDELKEVRAVMEVAKSGLTFQTCVSLALRKFYSLFRDFIVSLTTVLPQDFKTSSGDPFWSGAKRFPKAFTYDPEDPYHVMFVTSMANVLAAAFGLVPAPENDRNLLPATHEWRQPEYINAIVRSLPVPEYIPEKINMEGAGPGVWACVFACV
jgi:ubiquitin-activating enzyme E1